MKTSPFVKLTDAVSFGMGTPTNIAFWILAVAVWILLFATHLLTSNTNVLPGWFTSNAFNFPLNTVTTLAELYIGFLVAAAANRAERTLKSLVITISHTVTRIEAQNALITELATQQTRILQALLGAESSLAADESNLHGLLTVNTNLTREIHSLAQEIKYSTQELDSRRGTQEVDPRSDTTAKRSRKGNHDDE